MTRWLNVALKVSKRGIHNSPSFLTGAVIVRNGAVLSAEANYSRPFGTENAGYHAEVRAINKCSNCKGSTIIVARRNKKMSRPCPKCLEYIKSVGINKIIYYNWDGEPTVERIAC